VGVVTRPPRSWVVVTTVALLAAAAAWLLWPQPDPKQMSVAGLVACVAQSTHVRDDLASRASSELHSRPRGEVLAALRAMVADPGCEHRAAAIGQVAWLLDHRKAADAEHVACEAMLVAALDDASSEVRFGALFALAMWLSGHPSAGSETMLRAIRRALAEPDPSSIWCASLAAMHAGPLALPLLEDVLARLETEPSMRFMLACALGGMAPDEPRVIAVLTAQLDDDVANVRSAAAGWLASGTPGSVDATVLERLCSRFERDDESNDVRAACLEAFAHHVAGPDEAAACIPLALAAGAWFALEHRFVATLANLGRKAPHAPATAALLARLRAMTDGAEWRSKTDVACALARIAAAAGDQKTLDEQLAILRQDLADLETMDELELSFAPTSLPETLVELVNAGAAPEVLEPLRAVLRRFAAAERGWQRRWAERQLALLPPQ